MLRWELQHRKKHLFACSLGAVRWQSPFRYLPIMIYLLQEWWQWSSHWKHSQLLKKLNLPWASHPSSRGPFAFTSYQSKSLTPRFLPLWEMRPHNASQRGAWAHPDSSIEKDDSGGSGEAGHDVLLSALQGSSSQVESQEALVMQPPWATQVTAASVWNK